MRNVLLLVTALLILAGVNYTIQQREALLTRGRPLLLELAPIDPRSLMQGDYMALRFRLETGAFPPERLREFSDGRLVLGVDPQQRAVFRRFDDGVPLDADEALLRYRIRNGQPKLATNAFFFQEGTADRYQGARYGEFRVDAAGEAILVALRDEQLRVLWEGTR